MNLSLIELALDYLDRVISSVHITGITRFVAITVISDDDEEYIVPSIFVCNGNVKTRLKDLHLSSPSEGLGKRIENLVKAARPDAAFSILEDCHTVADDVRVFVSYTSTPQGLVNIKTFANGTTTRH